MNGRSFEFELTNEYKKIFAPLIELLNKNADKYYVAFRTSSGDRMEIYYKGQELISLYYKNGCWYAYTRTISSSKANKDLWNVNNLFLNELSNNNFLYRKRMLIDSNFDLLKFFEISERWVDGFIKCYVSDKVNEKVIQQGISNKYTDSNNELICVDTEYKLSASIKGNAELDGRADFLFLKKNNFEKFEIVLAELKSKRESCLEESGIIDHFGDMLAFKNEYNNNEEFRGRIKEEIVSYLKMKRKMGLFNLDITKDDISDNMNEFMMLFKMKKGHLKDEPHFKFQYHELIEEEYNSKKDFLLGDSLDEILTKIDTQKAYYLNDDFEFEEIK